MLSLSIRSSSLVCTCGLCVYVIFLERDLYLKSGYIVFTKYYMSRFLGLGKNMKMCYFFMLHVDYSFFNQYLHMNSRVQQNLYHCLWCLEISNQARHKFHIKNTKFFFFYHHCTNRPVISHQMLFWIFE